VVVLSVQHCTCVQEVAGSIAGRHHCAVTFAKLFQPTRLCHQAA